jgi:O-antigen/teichoic acid export membrane protein
MVNQLINRFRNSQDFRGKRILKNIILSAGLKGVNAAISFLVIPLYLTLLTEVSFGIWLTVSAVISWINFFDLGMGNGLRNRFAEALAKDDKDLARMYVSTTYFVLGALAACIAVLFFLANAFVDWSAVFAAPESLAAEVNTMVVVLVVLFLPQFVLQLVKMVITADQRPALANLMNTLVNVLQLIAIYVLVQQKADSLVTLSLVMGLINLIVPLIANFGFFNSSYRAYAPQWKSVQMKYAKDLMGLGFTFFVLQGAALVVFMTDNLIISRVLGPEEVPAYNIAFRYFNLASVFFGLVTIPFWSAFTDAYARQDMDWIRKMLRRLMALWAVVSVIGLGMFFAAPLVYGIWIGDVIEVPQVLNLAMMLWVVASTGMSIFGTFLSGVGKLRLSLYQAVVVMVINIPLSIYLAGFVSLGSAGVILASLFGVLIRLFFQPLQCWKILKGTATGIWGK